MPVDPGKAGKRQQDSIAHALAGALSGTFTAVFVCPLDVLKTRIQVRALTKKKPTGIIQGFSKLVKEEGYAAAYRGLTPTIIALLPTWALYFPVYERTKSSLAGTNLSTHWQHVTAAMVGGVANVAVTNPLWVVKTRLQTKMRPSIVGSHVRSTLAPNSFLQEMKIILCKEGLQGLYSGLVPSLIGITHVAVQFPIFEFLKHQAAERHNADESNVPMYEVLLASCLSKLVASTATYPHEVVRSQMHVSGDGVIEACSKIVQRSGVFGFYHGTAVNLLRTVPAAAITLTTYELLKKQVSQALHPEDKR